MSSTLVWIAFGAGWVLAASGGGAVLALLVRRAIPGASFARLWAFYAALLALGSAAFFAIGFW